MPRRPARASVQAQRQLEELRLQVTALESDRSGLQSQLRSAQNQVGRQSRPQSGPGRGRSHRSLALFRMAAASRRQAGVNPSAEPLMLS
jgi:hypothetical protein